MKIYHKVIIALFAVSLIGCGGAANTTTPPSATPTDVLKSFIEASKKKDAEAIKRTLSKGSLELAEKTAKTQNTTVDDMFKRDNVAMPAEIPETRNERIEGDAATVEVKNLTEGFDTIPFVREDGAWKLAFDKYQQAMMEKMRQEMNMSAPNAPAPNAPAANVSKPDGDRAPNAANKSQSNK